MGELVVDRNGDNLLKRIVARINDVRIKKKILILFVVGILIPIVFLVLFFFYQMQTELTGREKSLVQSELARIQINLSATVDTTSSMASTYFSDKDLAWALESYSNESKDSLGVIRKIDDSILSDLRVHPVVADMGIYFENKSLFETKYTHHINDKVTNTCWYKNFRKSNDSLYLGVHNGDNMSGIYMVRKLNLLFFEGHNFVKIELNSEQLKASFASELLAKEKSKIYLVDPNGQIAVSNTNEKNKAFSEITINSGNKQYQKMFSEDSVLKGWRIEVISNRGILYDSLNDKMLFLIVTFLIIIGISMVLFYGLAGSIITRLESMAKVMARSKYEELAEIPFDMGSDEIGIAAMQYNKMIRRTRELLNDNTRANDELQATNEELIASIDEIENKERQIDELIYKDRLTTLYNRFAITTHVDRILDELSASEMFAIGFLDIDNFKLINDTYGHDVGDEIIRHIGLRLKAFESNTIQIGRFGGDEFIIAVRGFEGVRELRSIYEKVRESVKETIIVNGISFALTISMGVSIYEQDAHKRHELIKLADIALYKAKELGRDQIVMFESSMHQLLEDKMLQQAMIRDAISEKQFVLFYQPYFDVKTRELKGCEALIRWKKTCALPMLPYQVIQCIEEMGLMIEFGFWIFKEACLFSKRLNKDRISPLVVSINISALQLMHTGFVDRVLDIVLSNDIDCRCISLEMTESILMNSIERGTSMLHRLRKAGITISLDDFGTGYSSLKYFKELPINTLKIDKSFIDNIATNQYDEQLVETMIQLAHNRKIAVIAEGIEMHSQVQCLEKMNCDMIQGYLFSKPISEEDMIQKALETV